MAGALITMFTRRIRFGDYEERRNLKSVFRAIGIAAAAGSAVLFILTENPQLPMLLIDKYTIYHLAIAAVAAAMILLAAKKDEQSVGDITKAY
jgi:hypothetical protein